MNQENVRRLAEELAAGPAFDPKYFHLWQRYGFHITPNHFYQPIPDISILRDSLWESRSELPGVAMNEEGQIEFLETVCEPYRTEYEQFPAKRTDVAHDFHFDQFMFRMVDAEVLYCTIRHFKPSRIIEIGSGYSTLVAAAACRKNRDEGCRTDLLCIEPNPNEILLSGVPGVSQLIREPLEQVGSGLFKELVSSDILFIDSSHVLRIGNDVYYEYLEIMPRLTPGVLVHIHDIFLPLEYPKEWIMNNHWFWTEQYLLRAFLTFNTAFRVLWAGCYMHCKHSEKLRKAFRSYDPASVLPGSFWIRRV
jgi:predicted O-methyltransferase YrrM